MTYPSYSKSELSTLAADAYQQGFNDAKYNDKINIKLLEETADDCAQRFEERKLNGTLNDAPESYKRELAKYLIADTLRNLALERIATIFWKDFNALIEYGKLEEARNIMSHLPACQMKNEAIEILLSLRLLENK